jgi:hypothetical protein
VASSKLCRGLPVEFSTFLEYSCPLGFEDKPDYNYIHDLFNSLSLREGLQNAVAFDWDADEQPQNPASNNLGDYAVGQPKHEGYAIFFFFTSYMLTSSSRLHSQMHQREHS